MQKIFLLIVLIIATLKSTTAQQTKTLNSAEILHEIQKLQVCGSVLYIAAHPDDENTRLLAYLANERKYRTGYLSLTRGDGGQNLIGSEQGIELGLIRTQELLAARRIDGAEQFFSSVYDFGFSKTSEETFKIWDKQKVLADVVWVIRKFKPDVIIARFPEDARAGHGHHAASGILAREAFTAAADRNMFPEQLKKGVSVWQAKRVLWNTFNFGGNNTINENQLKIDVGQYNSLLGKSYGELAALSRSQHKSQGFGVPSQRGSQLEYFTLINGDSMTKDIMDGVNTKWHRYSNGRIPDVFLTEIDISLKRLEASFSITNPQVSVKSLLEAYQKIADQPYSNNKEYMLSKLRNIIANCMGLYMEATTTMANAVIGDSLKINFSINSRLVDSVALKNIFYKKRKFNVVATLQKNKNFTNTQTFLIEDDEVISQPYWLQNEMEKGRFNIKEQTKIGQPDVDYEVAQFVFEIGGQLLIYEQPIQYKHTDPVKGEIFQPVYIVPNIEVDVQPKVVINTPKRNNVYEVLVAPKKNFNKNDYFLFADTKICDTIYTDYIWRDSLIKGKLQSFVINNHTYAKPACGGVLQYSINNNTEKVNGTYHLRNINYDHIPTINYVQKPKVKFVTENIVTTPKTIGYINGAGDKVAEALVQLGYKVDILQKENITTSNLKKYDAIITGVRAYNTNEWMNDVYDVLMQYIKDGGNLIVQYNTSNQIGPVKAKISPYSFNISRNRITDENAIVTTINPTEVVLNKPNKIVEKDFSNWIQERSIYEAVEVDARYRKIFTMNDANEKPTDGSLIIAPYGKGNFVYCSLVLFRELPAGVAGAYKLMANMIELPKN